MITIEIIFAVLQLGSLIFVFISLTRLFSYIRRYRFDESKYTLLFGFMHLHWFALLYCAVMFTWVGVSFAFLTSL